MNAEETQRAEKIQLYEKFLASGATEFRAFELKCEALARSRREHDARLWESVQLSVQQARLAVLSHDANEAVAAESRRRANQKADSLRRIMTLSAHIESLVDGPKRLSANGDGSWKWPVVVMRSGWGSGSIEDASDGRGYGLPHYFPPEFIAQVAGSLNNTRFRRRHPETGDGSDAPEIVAGWISDARVENSAVLATVNLLADAIDVRSLLLAARDAGQLSLFGVSIFAYNTYKRSQIDGKPALVAAELFRIAGVDMCAEPGAGGRFVEDAASPRATCSVGISTAAVSG